MSAEIFSVSPVVDDLKQQVSSRIKALNRTPRLAILRAVSDAPAILLEKRILVACRDLGVEPWSMELPSYLPQEILVSAVHKVGQDPSVDGVALICPEQYDQKLLGAAIGEEKDVGGLLRSASARFLPAFDSAILKTLQYYDLPLTGKTATIIGYSEEKHFILQNLLSLHGAEVFSVTPSTESSVFDRHYDYIFSAVDPSVLLSSDEIAENSFLFAIGTGFFGDSSVSADWIKSVSAKCSGIFPLPEGIDVLIPYIYAYNTAFSAQKR